MCYNYPSPVPLFLPSSLPHRLYFYVQSQSKIDLIPETQYAAPTPCPRIFPKRKSI